MPLTDDKRPLVYRPTSIEGDDVPAEDEADDEDQQDTPAEEEKEPADA